MSATTGIEWTEATWNPVTGCTKVSAGCDHCYAETLHERFHGKGSFATLTLHEDRLAMPLRWRKPRRIFVNSMSDLFHKDVPDEYIASVFAVMACAPQHTFQLLTKRHGRMRSLLSSGSFQGLVWSELRKGLPDVPGQWRLSPGTLDAAIRHVEQPVMADEPMPPLPNLWLGVSVEDQQWADIRIPALLDTPAAVRWISAEPLLGPLSLADYMVGGAPGLTVGLQWVVMGGESGHGARPMHPDWGRSLRDQCAAASVPFLFKQWGAWMPGGFAMGVPQPGRVEIGDPVDERGFRVSMKRVGKGAAGRELDGVTHDAYPQAVAS